MTTRETESAATPTAKVENLLSVNNWCDVMNDALIKAMDDGYKIAVTPTHHIKHFAVIDGIITAKVLKNDN